MKNPEGQITVKPDEHLPAPAPALPHVLGHQVEMVLARLLVAGDLVQGSA